MMLQYRLLSILVLIASTVTAVAAAAISDIAADSPLGQRVLAQATEAPELEQPSSSLSSQKTRRLQSVGRDISHVADYSLHYTGCSSQMQVEVNNGSNNNKNGNSEMIYVAHLAHFRLCPTITTGGVMSSCGDTTTECVGGGDYIMSLESFVDAYVEEKLSAQEYACEMIRENCYCQDIDDDWACEIACYTNAGQTACIEVEGQGDAFEVQRYLECREVEFNKDNAAGAEQQADANGNVQEYFVGPYCSPQDNYTVNLGVYYDQYCSDRAQSDVYMTELMYETELPYTTVSLVDAETCLDCRNVDENQNNSNNNNNDPQVSETCEAMYNYAAKCEQKMEISTGAAQDNSGCDFIHRLVPPPASDAGTVSPPPQPPTDTDIGCQPSVETNQDSKASQSLFEKCNPRSFSVVFGMAVTFGITTLVLLGAHAYLMYTATDNVPPSSATPKDVSSGRSVEMEA